MQEPRRLLLLELYRAIRAVAPDGRAAAATACAADWGLALQLEVAKASEAAGRLAVRLVHQVEMQGSPLCVRLGPLTGADGRDPALQAALVGAPLIAGRDGRLLLAIALATSGPAGGGRGALVDSETCARIAVAGGELESGKADATVLLELAGDLVPPIPAAGRSAGPDCVLVAALRLDAAQASHCLARPCAPTMRRNDHTAPG